MGGFLLFHWGIHWQLARPLPTGKMPPEHLKVQTAPRPHYPAWPLCWCLGLDTSAPPCPVLCYPDLIPTVGLLLTAALLPTLWSPV